MVERPAVNRMVTGSSPVGRAWSVVHQGMQTDCRSVEMGSSPIQTAYADIV